MSTKKVLLLEGQCFPTILGKTVAQAPTANESALLDIDELKIVLHPEPNVTRDPMQKPTIGVKWRQGGELYGFYHYFAEEEREPTAQEVALATNIILEQFVRTAKVIATAKAEMEARTDVGKD